MGVGAGETPEQPARWEAARSMWSPEANGMEGTGSGVISRVRCC